MKTIEEIENEIKAILYQYGITPADTPLMAVSLYVSQQIISTRQDALDMVIEHLKKGGNK